MKTAYIELLKQTFAVKRTGLGERRVPSARAMPFAHNHQIVVLMIKAAVKNAQNVRTGKGRPNKRRFALPCHFEYIAADAL